MAHKNVVILCDGVPDPEQEYLVQFKAGSTPFMLLDSNGVPITVNAESAKSNPEPEVPQPVAASPTPLEGPAARQAVTEEMLQSKSSAKRAELAAAKSLSCVRVATTLSPDKPTICPPMARLCR